MVAPLNPNFPVVGDDTDLLYPRNLGRGRTISSTGQLMTVSWSGGAVYVNGEFLFTLADTPLFLDLTRDALDHPLVCWQTEAGAGFVRFFDPVFETFVIFPCGQFTHPAILNDYILDNNDIILVYLIGRDIFYRVYSEKFLVARQLVGVQTDSILFFGVGRRNSPVVLGPF